ALLELKLAAIRDLNYEEFFAMFGEGRIANHREIYDRRLRPLLSRNSRRIWHRRIACFDGLGRGLYFSGLAGKFACLMNLFIDCTPGLRRDLDSFLQIDDIEQQAAFYRAKIAPRLWSRPLRWLLDRKSMMLLLGVPDEQMRQMQESGIAMLSSF